MDSLEVRLAYLRHGGEVRETARTLGMTPQAVSQAVQRANRRAPLTLPTVTLKGSDAEALRDYVEACLARVTGG